MRYAIIAPYYPPSSRAGGPPRVISGMATAVSSMCDVVVVTSALDVGAEEPYSQADIDSVAAPGIRLHYCGPRGPRLSLLITVCRRADIIHLHSLWSPKYALMSALVAFAVPRKRRWLVSPHGELAPSALARRRVIKSILLPLWSTCVRLRNIEFIATSENEMRDIQHTFKDAPIHIITPAPPPVRDVGMLAPDNCANRPARVAFIARIHPVKGLLPLLRATSLSTGQFIMDIYGPIEDAPYWEECLRFIERDERIRYRGELSAEESGARFQHYDYSALLTAGENFCYSIAESLAAGCSPIVTMATPWTSTVVEAGGILVSDRDHAAHIASILDGLVPASQNNRERAIHAYSRWRERSESAASLNKVLGLNEDRASQSNARAARPRNSQAQP